jgi:uncharacterized protein (TIGR02246 family)
VRFFDSILLFILNGFDSSMKSRPFQYLRAAAMLTALAHSASLAADQNVATEAIRATAKAYAEAFNRADATALAEYWSSEGTWNNPATGEKVTGRDGIRSGFAGLFQEFKGAHLEVEILTIKLLSPDVAVEEGTATVSLPGETPSQSEYTVIHVKENDAWLIDRAIETTEPAPARESSPLDEIAWLEGAWVDEAEGSTVSFKNEWVAGGRFMRRTFTVMVKDRIDITGHEVVGWDAADKQIRSWVFDSDGSFAELSWKRSDDDPNKWVKKASGVLNDGATVSAVQIMTKLDDDTYTFESVARHRDGELLPNIDKVEVIRSSPAP